MKILVINGPNMNMLGIREPKIYGSETLEDIQDFLLVAAKELNVKLNFFQSNHEGEIIDKISESFDTIDGIIINPAAYTHSSIAIHDALKTFAKPVIEVHISNIAKREEIRHNSITAKACVAQICGFGVYGYKLALNGLIEILNKK